MSYNTMDQKDRVKPIRDQLATVTSSMRDNIEIIIDRGQKIEDLQDSADHMSDSALIFQNEARRFRRAEKIKYWCKIFQIIAGIVALIVLMCVIIYLCSR